MSKKKTFLTPEERELFRHSVKINQPLQQDKRATQDKKLKKPLIAEPISKESEFRGEAALFLEKLSPNDWLTAQDYIHFARTGIPFRLLNKLKRGHLPIEARVDLHGLTGDEMLEKMNQFLQLCAQQKMRSILVVHGKGGSDPAKPPILKNVVNLWLRQRSEVLAFHSAKSKDGGTGALYV